MGEDTRAGSGCPVDHGSAHGPGGTVERSTSVPRFEERIGDLSRRPGARFGAWFLGYGLPTRGIRAGARSGDLIARMTVDPELRRDPFPAYEELRAGGPLARGRVVTATVDHAMSREVLKSPDVGVKGLAGPLPRRLARLIWRLTPDDELGPVDPPSLLSIDGALHTRHRRLVTREFAAKNVRQQTDRIREVATDLLDDLERDEVREFDLVDRYASQLPVAVIADMLGLPASDRGKLLAWGNGAVAMLDPDLTYRQYKHATTNVRKMHHWMTDHLRSLHEQPNDSLLGRLVQLEGDDRLDELELRGIALLLLGAGFETTVNLIGNAVELIERHPAERERLLAGEAPWSGASDEALRLESPVQLTARFALRDTVIGGEEVRRGQGVLIMLGGANRDPLVFDDPARFDPSRPNAGDHLALSHGAHYCIGANLARLEGAVALETLYERFPGLRLRPGAERRPTRILRGWERLPVVV